MQIKTEKKNGVVTVAVNFEGDDTVGEAMVTLCSISEAVITHLAEEFGDDEIKTMATMKDMFIDFGEAMIERASDIDVADLDECNYN